MFQRRNTALKMRSLISIAICRFENAFMSHMFSNEKISCQYLYSIDIKCNFTLNFTAYFTRLTNCVVTCN